MERDAAPSQRPRSMVDLADRQQFVDFLQGQTCYDMLPQSYKVIIFDTTLMVNKAFFAMVQNGAPLFFLFLFVLTFLYASRNPRGSSVGFDGAKGCGHVDGD